MNYVIERIRKKSGGSHEREARRKGHRVQIGLLQIGAPMLLVYVDDDDKVLRTSPVEAYSCEPDGSIGDYLSVQTQNTVYCFRREASE
jgi:hypothetical protein